MRELPTGINHERMPHRIGCWHIQIRGSAIDAQVAAVCNECGETRDVTAWLTEQTTRADLIKRLLHVAAYMADVTGTVGAPAKRSWPGLMQEAATAIDRLETEKATMCAVLKQADLYVDPTSSEKARQLSELIAKTVQA